MSKTIGVSQTVDSSFSAPGREYAGLIVGVSVQWNKYPSHRTRQIRVTVGKLAVIDERLSEESREHACAVLAAILYENETLCRELTGAIMEVVL